MANDWPKLIDFAIYELQYKPGKRSLTAAPCVADTGTTRIVSLAFLRVDSWAGMPS